MQATIQQLPSWMQIALALVPSISAVFAAIGLWLNVKQSRRTAAQTRAALVATFLRDFSDDEGMCEIFYAIEYDKFIYDDGFHESKLERQLDKLLVHFSNLALAWKAGLLETVDIQPAQYYVRMLLRNEGVKEYLRFVDDWADHKGLGEHPYLAVQEMGKVLGA